MRATGIALVGGSAIVSCIGSGGVPIFPDAGAGGSTDASGTSDSGGPAEGTTMPSQRGDATMPSGNPHDADILGDVTLVTASRLRFANWSPDSPPVDFCIAPHGSGAFAGPVTAALGPSGESGTTTLGFPLVSGYVAVPYGQYDVRVVVSGSTSCAVGITPDTTTLPAFGAKSFNTLALVGEEVPTGMDPGLQVVSFEDTTSSSEGAALRFVNAAPAIPAADFGQGSFQGAGGGFMALFNGVLFGTASTAEECALSATGSSSDAAADASGPVDANGYLLDQTLAGATLSAHDTRADTDSALGTVTVTGGVLTIALVGGTSSGIGAKLLECVDGASPGALSTCNVL